MARAKLNAVLEALRRACLSAGGAVQRGRIASRLRSDDDLAAGRSVRLDRALQYLAKRGEVSALVAGPLRHHQRKYYTVPDLPQRVAPTQRSDHDLLVDTVRAMWTWSSGRPFSSRALAQFAVSSSCADAALVRARASDKRQWWTVGLNQLRRENLLIVAERDCHGRVRWAPRMEWTRLASAERCRRLASVWVCAAALRRHRSRSEDTQRPSAGRNPPSCLLASNRQLALRVIMAAKAARTAAVRDPDQRRMLADRPVRFSELWAVATRLPGRPFQTRASLHAALAPARGSRRNAESHHALGGEVFRLGVVGREAMYDVHGGDVPEQGIVLQRVLRAIVHLRLEPGFDALAKAWRLSAAGLVIVPTNILLGRCQLLCGSIAAARARLVGAASRGGLQMLSPAEREEIEVVFGRLSRMLVQLDAWMADWGDSRGARSIVVEPPTAADLLDTEEAYCQLQPIANYALRYVVELPGRFRTVRVWGRARWADLDSFATGIPRRGAGVGARTRRAHQSPAGAVPSRTYERDAAFDRVELAAYVIERFGSPRYAAWACGGMHLLGRLRDARLLANELLATNRATSEAALAEALGLMDNSAARAALVEYLQRSVPSGPAERLGASAGGCEAAVLGLARLPVGGLATALAGPEARVLARIRDRVDDLELRGCAAHVLMGWADGFSGRQWLDV